MPENPGMAFVLVPHLDPSHASILPQLVQKCTHMKVLQVEDGLKILPNTVYIVPPNKDLAMLHGTLQLIEPTKAEPCKVAHQLFFPVLSTRPKRKGDLYCSVRHGDGRRAWP
jgi:two-component system, chemotaxis family, CheB/CheR fusion protein